MPLLEVRQISQQDMYKDIIRINEVHRIDKEGKTIKEGQVCLVRANGKKCRAVLRGYLESDAPEIRMDDHTRTKLDLKLKTPYEFEFKPATLVGQWLWAWNATEMGYQVSSRLAILGFVMGVLGLLFGIASLVDWHWLRLLWRLLCLFEWAVCSSMCS